jgi:hypothetical protein
MNACSPHRLCRCILSPINKRALWIEEEVFDPYRLSHRVRYMLSILNEHLLPEGEFPTIQNRNETRTNEEKGVTDVLPRSHFK